jgi:hypothetical protein
MFLKKNKVCNTISAMEDRLVYYDNPSYLSAHDIIRMGTGDYIPYWMDPVTKRIKV